VLKEQFEDYKHFTGWNPENLIVERIGLSFEFIRDFMRGKTSHTESTPSEHGEHTERIRPEYSGFKPTELVHFSIRLRAADLAVLREHFQRIDIPMSQGVRQIVLDYMSSKGLR
jgi:hypothetical protein